MKSVVENAKTCPIDSHWKHLMFSFPSRKTHYYRHKIHTGWTTFNNLKESTFSYLLFEKTVPVIVNLSVHGQGIILFKVTAINKVENQTHFLYTVPYTQKSTAFAWSNIPQKAVKDVKRYLYSFLLIMGKLYKKYR